MACTKQGKQKPKQEELMVRAMFHVAQALSLCRHFRCCITTAELVLISLPGQRGMNLLNLPENRFIAYKHQKVIANP
jgi:hypothetical protein